MRSVDGIVFNIMRYSVQDGPGIRTTVFLKGCPLSCLWCHNPESQAHHPQVIFRSGRCLGCGDCLAACPEKALSLDQGRLVHDPGRCTACLACVEACPSQARDVFGRKMTAGEVLVEVLKDRAFFDESGGGVTFSGGEPLARPKFLGALLSLAKGEGLHTAVDTSGAASRAVLEEIFPLVDLFLYDMKFRDPIRHHQATGRDNRRILENLVWLDRVGAEVRVRVPVIPGFNDDDTEIRAIGAFVANLTRVRYIELLPFHETAAEKYRLLGRTHPLRGTGRPTVERLLYLSEILKEMGLIVSVGG